MTSQIEVGSWVKSQGRKGFVRDYCDKYHVLVRWVGENRASRCYVKDLKICNPPRALLLEGSLDRQLHSTRSEEDMLRTWLRTHNVLLAFKNIHVLDDIDMIGKAIGQNKPSFVHISCHGNLDDENRPYIVLPPKYTKDDYIYLDDSKTIDVFKKHFSGLPILFSACLLGRYQTQMTEFRQSAGLLQVAAFTRVIYDYEAILFELLVYHGILENGWNFSMSIDKANKALSEILVRGSRGRNQILARVF